MYQGRKIKINYIKYIFMMLVLLASAVFGPQLLFAVQDKHNQENIWLGERDSMDIAALNVGYTESLGERLKNYAKGLAGDKKYYANVTDYEVDAECYEIMETVLNSSWGSFLDSFMVLDFYDSIYKGYDVQNWKRYTIYDEEFENGVAIMAWYFELYGVDERKIKVLVDTEDYTLYYLEMEVADKVYDYYGYGAKVPKNSSELLEYFAYYYEIMAGEENIVGVDKIQETYNTSRQDSLFDVYMVYLQPGLYNIMLPYEGAWLHWELEATQSTQETPARISVGIREIGELIPEFSAG